MLFNRIPGALTAVSQEDDAMFIVTTIEVGHTLQLPDELGSQQLNVRGKYRNPCLQCKTQGAVYYELEKGYVVVECVHCQKFFTYREQSGSSYMEAMAASEPNVCTGCWAGRCRCPDPEEDEFF